MPPRFDHNVCATSVQAEGVCPVRHSNPPWAELRPAELPLLPALPLTLAQMELLLHGPVVNLSGITEVAKHDAGLSAQLLLLANRDREESDRFYRIEDCLVQIGVSPLRELVRAMPPLLPCDWRYGMLLNHSRITALAAEAIAFQRSAVDPEKAYLAGLLHVFPDLVSLTTWAVQMRGEAFPAWPLPMFAWNVIRWFKHPFAAAGQEHRLCEVVLAACEWAGQAALRSTPDRRAGLTCT
jgi:hypothetical protein